MRARMAFGLAAMLALGACGNPKPLYVDHAWVRLAAVKTNPAAAYFTIHGGPTDAKLISVTTDVAVKAELHESMNEGGMASMKPLQSVAVPAKTQVAFAPGGRHVMFYYMNPGITPGKTITLTFAFASGERILQDASVIAAGDPAPQ